MGSTNGLNTSTFSIFVNLTHNHIKELPNNPFPFMGAVDLSYNELSHVPNQSFHGIRLTALNLSYNAITRYVLVTCFERISSFSYVCDGFKIASV